MSRHVLARPPFNPQTLSNILITSFIYSQKTYISPLQSDLKNPPELFVQSNFNYSTLSGGCWFNCTAANVTEINGRI